MATTIKDIAKDVGVNVATVSCALNDKPGVSPELRALIQRKAEELHYVPHGQARGLVMRQTETVGLLYGDETSMFLSNPFYAEVLAGVEGEMRKRGFSLMFSSTAGDGLNSPTHIPKFVAEHRVDGILIIGALEDETIRSLKEIDLPFLVIDYHLPDAAVDAVLVDNRRGARMATEHLVELGHHQLAFVGGAPLDHGNFSERLEGYREALIDAGLPIRDELICGGDVEGGFESTKRILEEHPKVTAVVACNDANALGAIRAAHVTGHKVPVDVSVVGFDDIAAATQSWPCLTTVRVNKRAMGRTAARRLCHKMRGDETNHNTRNRLPTGACGARFDCARFFCSVDGVVRGTDGDDQASRVSVTDKVWGRSGRRSVEALNPTLDPALSRLHLIQPLSRS